MSRYGKGMRDCCDSPAQNGQVHIVGCVNFVPAMTHPTQDLNAEALESANDMGKRLGWALPKDVLAQIALAYVSALPPPPNSSELVRELRRHHVEHVSGFHAPRDKVAEVLGRSADTIESLTTKLDKAREALDSCAAILPRYAMAGKTVGDDEELAAVTETVDDARAALKSLEP